MDVTKKKATQRTSAASAKPRPRKTAKNGGRYTKTRQDHSSEIAEDYVELINQLIRKHGEARTVDIADELAVSHVTVTKTIGRLQREGLVHTAPYRSIFLTEAGQRLAEWSERRHALVVAFLRKLGVNQDDAERDAEGIEHHLSEATLAAFAAYVNAPEAEGA
jgi:DtxR family manganese transport transcriptional regulator